MRWARLFFLPAAFLVATWLVTQQQPAFVRVGDHALSVERIGEAEALFNVPWKTGK